MPFDDDEFEVEDFGRRITNQQLGGRTTIVVPQGLAIFKPKKADGASHTIDLVPFKVTESHLKFIAGLHVATPGKWYPERTFYAHRRIGVNNDSYVCPASTYGRKCPICEGRAQLLKSPAKEDKELADDLKCSMRQLWLVWDSDDPDKGVQLWDESNWNFGRHLVAYVKGARKQDQDAYKAFYHPLKGFTMRIVCSEVAIGGGKNYEYRPHQFYPRTQPLPDNIIHHGYNLDDMIHCLEYNALRDIYEGRSEDDVPPEETKAETRRTSAPAKAEAKPRPRPEPEPEPEPRQEEPKRREAKPEPTRDEEPKRTTRPAPAPTPPADDNEPLPFATNDRVSFEWKGETLEGVVKAVDERRRLAVVEVEGFDKPFRLPVEDCTVTSTDDTFDKKPATNGKHTPAAPAPAKAESTRGSKWDDDDDDNRSAPPKRAK